MRKTLSKSLPVLTVSAWLNGSLNVPDALDGHAVLVVAVNELVFELADLVNEHTKLIRHVRHVVVTCFSPDGELLLCALSVMCSKI